MLEIKKFTADKTATAKNIFRFVRYSWGASNYLVGKKRKIDEKNTFCHPIFPAVLQFVSKQWYYTINNLLASKHLKSKMVDKL